MKPNKTLTYKPIAKEEMKEKSITSLRNSFEFEGVFFTDEEIQKMVSEVRSKGKNKTPFTI